MGEIGAGELEVPQGYLTDSFLDLPPLPGVFPGLRPSVVARSEFEFNRQSIVVADDDSSAAAFVIDTLRLDGHRVTYLSDVQSATVDAALSGCHLFICGSGIGGMRAVTLLTEIRDNAPDLPILCVAAALRWTRRLEGRLPADVTILRDPLTADALRAGVRPLLPLSAGGTTLAWSALVEHQVPRAPAERLDPESPDEPPRA